MLHAARLLILGALVLTSCHTAKTAAVTTFRVIDAPARFVRDRIDPPNTTTTTTMTERATVRDSDVDHPGRPVNPPVVSRSTASTPRTMTENRTAASSRPGTEGTRSQTNATRSSSAPKTAAAGSSSASEFPTARPVPGKPGFVYSIDPKGGMIDVTGYKSGDKAKDPYTHQVFIVP